MERKKIIYNIEFLRIILICAVIVHHFYFQITKIWTTGWIAVEFFFVISGFCFAYSYNPQKSFIEFTASKLIRFLPLLYLPAIIVAICTKFDIQRLFADIFLLQNTGLYNTFGYNRPGWFVDVLFWILLFYFSILKNIRKGIANIIFGLLTFCALAIIQIQDIHIFRGIGAFGIGYFTNLICNYFSRSINNEKSIILSGLEFIGISYFTIISFSFYQITNRTALVIQMGIVLILLYLKKGYISSLLEKSSICRISKYILPVYLTHVIVYIPILNPLIKYYGAFITKHPCIISAVGVLLSWLFGILIYHLVQKPINSYLKRLLIDKTQNLGGG